MEFLYIEGELVLETIQPFWKKKLGLWISSRKNKAVLSWLFHFFFLRKKEEVGQPI